eukprot:351219-Chlamydomonas_euryale.AAC.9
MQCARDESRVKDVVSGGVGHGVGCGVGGGVRGVRLSAHLATPYCWAAPRRAAQGPLVCPCAARSTVLSSVCQRPQPRHGSGRRASDCPSPIEQAHPTRLGTGSSFDSSRPLAFARNTHTRKRATDPDSRHVLLQVLVRQARRPCNAGRPSSCTGTRAVERGAAAACQGNTPRAPLLRRLPRRLAVRSVPECPGAWSAARPHHAHGTHALERASLRAAWRLQGGGGAATMPRGRRRAVGGMPA